MQQSILTVEGVTKSFNNSNVLSEVTFELRPGEVLGIIGKSGSGKSVLIHTIRGSKGYKPETGKIIYHFEYCKACDEYDHPGKIGETWPKCGKTLEKKSVNLWELSESEQKRIKRLIHNIYINYYY